MNELAPLWHLLDPLLIAPYRLSLSAGPAFWLGTAFLAGWCLLIGEITMALVWLCNRSHYEEQNREMVRMHNLSIKAVAAKDKASYKASNSLANESFGKAFFAQAALFSTSVWSLPFALGWLAWRFGGVDIPTPLENFTVGYSFVLIGEYIVIRLLFSRIRHRVPFLRTVQRRIRESAANSGEFMSWSDLEAAPGREESVSRENGHGGNRRPLPANP